MNELKMMSDQNQNNEGFNLFARIIQDKIITHATQIQGNIIDFGTINADYSLKTNTFPLPIPVSDYQVCRTLTYGKTGAQLTTVKQSTGQHPHGDGVHSGLHKGHTGQPPDTEGEHTHPNTEGGHNHPVLIPEKMRSLLPGDRVLVVWVGNDAVVVDILFPATAAM